MWVPVDIARRTVRKGRSPYTMRLSAAACHSSMSRSMTADEGSRATIAPLSAPTEVPSTRSGTTPRSKSACSMPTSAAPRTPPPPSTKAVVTGARSRGDQLRVLGAHLDHDPVLDPEDQERDQPRDQAEHREGNAPAGPPRE